MPIPLIPVVAAVGLGAWLLGGATEKKASDAGGASSPGASATPTQASTGGPGGGAQVPSHSDIDATDGRVASSSGSSILTDPAPSSGSGVIADPVPSSSANPIVEGFQQGYTTTGDPWAGDPDYSKSGALGQVAGIAGATTKVVSQTFEKWADSLGAIW